MNARRVLYRGPRRSSPRSKRFSCGACVLPQPRRLGMEPLEDRRLLYAFSLVPSGAALSYHVPTLGEDVVAWTATDFDDSTWTDSMITDGSRVVITEIDIENLIRAKGAIYSGCMTLLTEVGMRIQDVEHIILAGGFGSYVDLEKASTKYTGDKNKGFKPK